MERIYLIVLILSCLREGYAAEETLDFCLREDVSILCQEHEIIMVTEATYGRMRSGRCITGEYGSSAIGCSVDVTPTLEGVCSGRQQCQTETRMLMDIAIPCPRDLTPYLEVKYKCQPVASGSPESCRHPQADNYIRVSGAEGYIPSRLTQDAGYGTAACPWLVQVSPGQRINFTLLDFNEPSQGLSSDGGMDAERYTGCPLSIIIEENGETKTDDICTGGPRERRVHVTTGSTARVHFIVRSTQTRQRHFILKYKAIGCVDLNIPPSAWMRRDGENVQVTCNSTGEIWYLTCRDGTWIGDVGDCDGSPVGPGKHSDNSKFPFGLILAVIIGIVLGVVVGVTLLAVVFICRRGYKQRPKSECHESYLEQSRPGQAVAVDLYSEGIPSFCTGPKPCDPRAISGVLSPEYSYKYAIQRKSSGENTPLRKGSDPRVTEIDVLRKQPRAANIVVTRSHVYESPKFGKVLGATEEPPPVYHELDSENDDQTGRYTN